MARETQYRGTMVWLSALTAAAGLAMCVHACGPTPLRSARTDAIARAIQGGRAHAVILLIGDGMGDSEITLARNYHLGAAGRLALDTLPLTGSYTTYAVQEADPSLPEYVTDSAASATAWSTGHKTSNGRLSTAAATNRALPTLVELAHARGLRTGNITTAELTDATPAALVAHISNRRCAGPADMERCRRETTAAGGLGSIAEQTIAHDVDVLLGGGRQRFVQRIDGGPEAGQSVLQAAAARGYTVITTAAQLAAAAPGRKLLGLFAEGDLSHEWSGAPARAFPGSGPQRCLEGQRPAAEPSLAAMTTAALTVLDGDGQGFFLQVEGASIDKSDHAADPCGQIGETVAFDAAVRVALDYAQRHTDTLVVVTADHAHTSQIVPPPSDTEHSPGAFSRLITADGAQMTVSYATNLPGHLQQHTGTQVRIAAQGPQAADVVGISDQTDLFFTITDALGLQKMPAVRDR